jgi:hypothetical protein
MEKSDSGQKKENFWMEILHPLLPELDMLIVPISRAVSIKLRHFQACVVTYP